MTPPPDRAPTPQSGPSVIGLVKRDIGRAVRDAAAQTDSPYFGHAALHRDLGRLRERLTLLEQRRPDLLTQVADHFDVPPTAGDVATAAQDLADRFLERRYAQADPDAAARISRAADTATARLRADTPSRCVRNAAARLRQGRGCAADFHHGPRCCTAGDHNEHPSGLGT